MYFLKKSIIQKIYYSFTAEQIKYTQYKPCNNENRLLFPPESKEANRYTRHHQAYTNLLDNKFDLQSRNAFVSACVITLKNAEKERTEFLKDKKTGPNYHTKIKDIIGIIEGSQSNESAKNISVGKAFFRILDKISKFYRKNKENLTPEEEKARLNVRALKYYLLVKYRYNITRYAIMANPLSAQNFIKLITEELEEQICNMSRRFNKSQDHELFLNRYSRLCEKAEITIQQLGKNGRLQDMR